MNTITKPHIIAKLKTVMDPELNVSIYDMGLIYDIVITKTYDVHITMTLTSMGCPLFTTMESSIIEEIQTLPGVRAVTVDLTFEPPWTMDMMTKEAKEQLGFLS